MHTEGGLTGLSDDVGQDLLLDEKQADETSVSDVPQEKIRRTMSFDSDLDSDTDSIIEEVPQRGIQNIDCGEQAN